MLDIAVPRIGELLCARGVLTRQQLETILTYQTSTGRPLGWIAEQLCQVDPCEVVSAWCEQYVRSATFVDLDNEVNSPHVLDTVSRRQAWQFQILPLRREDGVLVIATAAQRLDGAANFTWRRLNEPVYLVVAKDDQLKRHVMERYPWPTMADPSIARWIGDRAHGEDQA